VQAIVWNRHYILLTYLHLLFVDGEEFLRGDCGCERRDESESDYELHGCVELEKKIGTL
jgi:hypothetical protein